MRPRFLIVLRDRARSAIDCPRLAANLGLTLVEERPGLAAFTSGDARAYTAGEARILGTLIPRFGPAAPTESGPIENAGDTGAQAIEERLLSRYYGGYIALLPTAQGVRILRDPSGALPCYYRETTDGFVLASDVDLLLEAGIAPPAVDWEALIRFYYLRGLPTPETCLAGIEELLPGYALDIFRGIVDQRMRWSPWDYITEEDQPSGLSLPEHLRRVTQHSVQALTAAYDRLLVSVSGGVDSSIVAACLATARRDARCVTIYTDDPAGDERFYARALCEHLGLPLFERPYRVEAVDIDAPVSPHLPRPIGRSLSQAYDSAHLEVAEEMGADAFVTGNGGDNVFGFSQSGAAIIDRYLRHGLSPGLLATVRDICRQTESGPLAVVRAALRSRRRGYRWTPGPMFLDAAMVAALAPGYLHQPWLDAPNGTGPAKAAHVAALLRVQQLLEPTRSGFAPVITPLVSQPMLEACLAIPAWRWRDGGRDRAVARDAFSADLPSTVSRRRTKGGPDGFAAMVVDRHRDAIRERLLDGQLVRNHVADRGALERRFRSEIPFTAEETVRLLDLADTEAWVAAWQQRSIAAGQQTARHGPSPGPPTV